MIKVNYTELDGPYGPAMRLEAAGHAGYAPAGQDIVCAGVSTLMQALVSLLAGEENAHSDAFDEPDGPRLTVTAARPCTAWVEGAFELAKAGFALLAERYPDNVCFADRSARGKQEMMDLQLFADGGEAAAPALSAAQEQQAVASGTMKPGEKADAKQETTTPEGEKEVKETEPVKAEEGQEQEPPRPALPKRFPGSQAVDALHRRWAAEEAMMRRAVPEFSLQKERADPEMRRLMQLPGMRMLDAYRLAHYGDAMRQTARTVEQVVGGIAGASGLALDERTQTLYISDLGSRCIWSAAASSHGLTAGGKGCQSSFSGLPGYPGALALDEDSTLYISYRWASSSWLERHAGSTFLRGVALRLSESMQENLFSLPADGIRAEAVSTASGSWLWSFSGKPQGSSSALCPVENRVYFGIAGEKALYSVRV